MAAKQINPRLIELARLTHNPNLKTPDLDEQIQQPLEINLQGTSKYWRVRSVEYRNGIYTVDLAKSLLDSGATKTQDEWAKYSVQAKKSGDFYTGDMPLYHAVFASLFKQKDKPESEGARAFIQKEMRARWLMTLTRIAYQPKGKDKIIHNFGTSEQYSLEENIVGKDRFIENSDSSALTALLGIGDITQIKKVYNWINGTDTYIWRLNSKPKNIDERVARFVADSDWADLDCYGDPVSSYSSLGVFAAREI